jgi:CBS domain-containing protein
MNLGEQFRRNVATVEPEATLADAGKVMKERNVGDVVVVEYDEPVGILTDRDLAMALAVDGQSPQTPVSEVMSKPALTIREDQGVFNATQYMLGHQVRRLPVVDEDEKLVGIVTLDDMLRLLSRELSNVVKSIEPALEAHA